MEGKWVAAAYMKNRDRFAAWFAGGNQQVSAIGKHACKFGINMKVNFRFLKKVTISKFADECGYCMI